MVKSPPDGNTWLAVFDNHAANPFVLPPLPYDSEKDLDPVLLIGTAPYVITTAAAKPYKTLADLLAFAKDNPGKVSYGSVGSGSVGHLAMALLSQRAGVKRIFVSPEAVTTYFVGFVTDAERLRRTVDVLSRVAGGGLHPQIPHRWLVGFCPDVGEPLAVPRPRRHCRVARGADLADL